MSQWGTEKILNGARFVPLVDTMAFRPVSYDSIINDVLIIDDGGQPDQALITLGELQSQYVGKPHCHWQIPKLQIIKIYKRFWWPHPYAKDRLTVKVVVGFRYLVDGVIFTLNEGLILPPNV